MGLCECSKPLPSRSKNDIASLETAAGATTSNRGTTHIEEWRQELRVKYLCCHLSELSNWRQLLLDAPYPHMRHTPGIVAPKKQSGIALRGVSSN